MGDLCGGNKAGMINVKEMAASTFGIVRLQDQNGRHQSSSYDIRSLSIESGA